MDELLKPGARWTVVRRAGQFGEYEERFAQEAFDGMVGRVTPVTFNGAPFARGRLVSAVVADDGLSVEFTFEAV